MKSSEPAMITVALSTVAVISLVALIPVPESSPETVEQIKQEQVIDYCWDQYSKKSLAPEGARFLAGACELAERKYHERFGRWYTINGERP